jgi:hypothetical protein
MIPEKVHSILRGAPMRSGGTSIALLLFISLAVRLHGQSSATSHTGAVQLESTLGNATVALSGPWRFHIGDDMAWAQQGFDDSDWGTIDLTPRGSSVDDELGTGGLVKGWTGQGYPDHAGFAWYRLRVNVHNSHGRLAIKMPNDFDDAYQVYANGQLIGQFGKFGKHGVTAYSSLPIAFRLPPDASNGLMTIAVRMWMDSATPFNFPDAGGMHEPPILGRTGVISALVREDQTETVIVLFSGCVELLILFLALTVAVMLFWMDRTEPAYLWFSAVCGLLIFSVSFILLINFSARIGQTTAVVLMDVINSPLQLGLWIVFWAFWFRRGRMALLHRVVWGQVLLLMICTTMLRPPLYGQIVLVHALFFLQPIALTLKLTLAITLFVITFQGIRKQKTEGWLAFCAVLLVAISMLQHELPLLHVETRFLLLGFNISLGTIATIFSLLLITALVLHRFLQTQRRREQWKTEIEQAQQVQHVLIPDELPTIAGFAIESEYRPAREVGGDFFQIMPGQEPGSALIVVGDVTGKGLQAGMLVAVIVGALRTAAQYHSDPLPLMNALNDQLSSRGGAVATCQILRITSSGDVTLANAGHLAPYLNGVEMPMEGALPIGMLPEADFSVMHFHLALGDTLMLMSDGVAEAQDEHKNLFGFERIRELLQQQISAATLASAAQEFGQEDDILVLRIQRQPESEGFIEGVTTLAAT